MNNTTNLVITKQNKNHYKVTPLVAETLTHLYDKMTTDSLELSCQLESRIFENFDKFTNAELESYRSIATKIDEHFKDDWRFKGEQGYKSEIITWEAK
jgi:hypothetical protein